MENPTSFDLNRAIQRWREILAQSPAFRTENLEELETHLRDSIVALQTCGLSSEEAFVVAAKRVGGETALEKEYAKVNGRLVWIQRGLWMLIGIQAWQLVYGFINLLSQNAAFFAMKSLGFHFASGGLALPVSVFCAVSLAGLIGSVWLCWLLCGRPSESISVWLGKMSQSIGASFAMFVIMCVVLLSNSGIGMLLEILRVRNVSPADYGYYVLSRQYVGLIMLVVQTATLLGLTLFLVHKRMRTSKA